MRLDCSWLAPVHVPPSPDIRCQKIAASQHGIVTKDQALEAGLTSEQIKWRGQSGRWKTVYPRVFVIGGAPVSWHQRLLAACLWAGPLAAASYRSAAILWGLDGTFDRLIEISVPRKLMSNGVVVHRVATDLPGIVVRDGIPVTDPTTTLFNLAAVLPPSQLEVALESAIRRRLTHQDLLLDRLLEVARSGRNGIRLMRRVLEVRDPSSAPTASTLETTLDQLIKRFDLPRPERQHVVRDEEGNFVARIDFAYPEAKIAIEAQSYAHHHGRQDWERDQDRFTALSMAGWLFICVTHRQMKRHPEVVARRIRRALRRRIGF